MNKGDKVKVLVGPHTDQTGTLTAILNEWYYIRLDDGIVEFHCKDEALAKIQEA